MIADRRARRRQAQAALGVVKNRLAEHRELVERYESDCKGAVDAIDMDPRWPDRMVAELLLSQAKVQLAMTEYKAILLADRAEGAA